MRFRILGPLEVDADDGRALQLGGPKQRAVLAHLLLRAGRVVPTEVLIDELWGDDPPDTARGTVQAYVSRLRGVLGEDRLAGRAGGYVLGVGPDELDAERFVSLVEDARADLTQDPATAVAALEEALSLWRGPALADLAEEPSLAGEIARLEELRLAAAEEKVAAGLALGDHVRLVSELEALIRRHPLRERLWGDLMIALYRSGRQAEALEAYARARQVLADELGIDPSRRLRRLHQQMLAQDPGLSSPSHPIRAPAKPVTVPGDLAPETELAGYRIEDVLGRGGMSTVYLAEDLRLRRRIALKVLAAELSAQPGFRERFVRESQIAAGIEHPGIVPIYEAGEAEGHLYIAMRYVRGIDLRRLLGSSAPLDPERAVHIVRRVAEALDAAHAEGLVHRDVKPGNVLLVEGAEEDGRDLVYLSDFGLTKRLEGGSGALTRTGQFVGTVEYVAPEQIEGGKVDGRADVYSLACVLFECLTGCSPFRRDTEVATLYAHVHETPPPVGASRPGLPEALDGVIAKALAKDPDRRFPTCRAFAAAARDALEPQDGTAGVRASPPGRRLGVVVGVALTTALLAGALVYATTRTHTRSEPPGQPSRSVTASPTVAPHFATLDRAFTQDERALLGSVPASIRSRCAPYRPPALVLGLADDAIAGVACDDGPVHVLYERFASRDQMDAAFGKRANAIGAYAGNCATDASAQNRYAVGGEDVGRVVCDRRRQLSHIAWTDARVLVFGEAFRDDEGDVALFQWWREAGPTIGDSSLPKDVGARVAQPPVSGSYLTSLSEDDRGRLPRAVRSLFFAGTEATLGIHLSDGSYSLSWSSLGRFAVAETGTYVVAKGPLLVLSSGCGGAPATAVYRADVTPDGSIRWTFERGYGEGYAVEPADRCIPGPWPFTFHPWVPGPPGRIVFTSAQAGMIQMDLSTLTFTSLPTGADADVQPVWSPDGTRIAFASDLGGEGDYDLYAMDADGSNVVQLTSGPTSDLDPAWSPDGSRIAFHRGPLTGATGPSRLSVLDLADGSITDLVSRAGNVGRPSWSPDGSRIVFRVLPPDESVTDVRRLYLVNADGGGLTVLDKEHVEVTDVPTTWTPDGRRIVFWGSGGPGGKALLTMRPDGSDVRPFGTAPPTMADGASVGGVPSWSSDGRWFVIGGLWDHPGPLYLMSVDGRHVFVLENSAGEPRWGPG